MTRYLLDMCVPQGLLNELVALGADAVRFSGPSRAPDSDVLGRAFLEGRVLVTNDKDFGDLVLRKKHACAGAILVRVEIDVETSALEVAKRILEIGESAIGQFATLDSSGFRSRTL